LRADGSTSTGTRDAAPASLVDAHNVHVLLQTLAAVDPDVVYHWDLRGVGGLGLILAVALAQVPSVWQVMDSAEEETAWSGAHLPTVLDQLLGERWPDTVICSNPRWPDELRERGIRLPGEVRHVPYWSASTVAAQRQKYLEDGILRAVMGPGVAREDLELMLHSLGSFVASGRTNVHLDLFGELDPDWRAVAGELGVDGYVCPIDAGMQAPSRVPYEQYDVFVFPSVGGHSYSIDALDAARAGCIPVLGTTAGNAHWMVDGVDCLKAPGDPEALAVLLAGLADATPDLAALGHRASRSAREVFGLPRVASTIEGILTERASSPRAGSPVALDKIAGIARLAENLLASAVT
jgi:glycosyltransferase involved in cell wall biosynthesis